MTIFPRSGIWLAALALAACAHDPKPPRVVVQEVRTPVAVPCDAKPTQRPAYPDTDAAVRAAPDDELLKLLWAGRKVRDGYIGELEAAIAGCAKPSGQPAPGH